jgi:hypothetical protein
VYDWQYRHTIFNFSRWLLFLLFLSYSSSYSLSYITVVKKLEIDWRKFNDDYLLDVCCCILIMVDPLCVTLTESRFCYCILTMVDLSCVTEGISYYCILFMFDVMCVTESFWVLVCQSVWCGLRIWRRSEENKEEEEEEIGQRLPSNQSPWRPENRATRACPSRTTGPSCTTPPATLTLQVGYINKRKNK